MDEVKSDITGNVHVNIEDPEKTKFELKKTEESDGVILKPNDAPKPVKYTDNNLANLKDVFRDILAGDTDALNRPEFSNLNFKNVQKAIEWLAKNNSITDLDKAKLATEGWRMTFRFKPPTPHEFLTPKYIGDQANSLYPWIRQAFEEYLEPTAAYRNLILSSCIGTGKSQPLDSKVYLTPTEYKLMKDIQVGDTVLTPTGTSKVKATIDWEPEDIYELEMEDGRKMKCGLHHLHNVSYRKDKQGIPIWENVETQFLLDHPDYEFEFKHY